MGGLQFRACPLAYSIARRLCIRGVGHQSLIALKHLPNQVVKHRLSTLNQFRFLLLADLDSKLAKISAHGVPVLLLRLVSRQVLEIVDVRIEWQRSMRLSYHCLAHL